jgi:signal transduction histidine kinase
LLVSTPNDCRLWDFEGGREIALFAGMWGQFSGDGQALFIFTKEALHRYELTSALLRSADEFKPEIVFRAPAGQRLHGGFLSPDGRTLTIGLATGGTVLLDVEKNTMTRHPGVRSHDAELSPDGAMLAARLHNYPVLLVNATNGSTITQMVGVAEVVFSPDGKWILAKTQDKLRLLERASLALAREWHLDVGAGGPPSVAFSPDSATLAVAHNRFDARLLEISSGRELATFSPPHPGQVGASRSITFSRNGRWLVVGKQDGEVVAWDLPVVRAELARLGLNWGETLNPVLNSDVDLSAGSESKPDNKLAIKSGEVSPAVAAVSEQSLGALATSSPALSIAFGAIALALTAGLFISLHQRRMLSAYARAEALAIEQQQKLQIAQEELQHSQKMRALGTLAAGIAHDFNNLLSIIRLSNQLAAEQTQATGTAKENIDAIESAVAQGETIVQSMLGYSRAAAELESEYSVAAAVSETVAMLGRKFLAGIVLQLEIQPDIPAVRGVRGRLEQMLLNLVVNASDAMNSRGTLRLTANIVFDASACLLKPKPAREYVCISVGDSGPGISAEALPRIFEPFFTTKSAGARPGTGLGLSTVYTMAQQDGVGLAVETSAGRGTTFQILVPVAEGERNKPTAKPASVP